jgi:hypothetical protein
MKLRFSLRTMLILVTLVAALCWWRDRPRRLADHFVEAVEAGRYEAADSLFSDSGQRSIVEFMERDDRNRIHAKRKPQSPSEWLKGQCGVALTLVDFGGLGGDIVVHMQATSHGMGLGSVVEHAKPVQYDGGLLNATEFSQ